MHHNTLTHSDTCRHIWHCHNVKPTLTRCLTGGLKISTSEQHFRPITLGPAYNESGDAKETARYKWVLVVNKLSNIAVNDIDASGSCAPVLELEFRNCF